MFVTLFSTVTSIITGIPFIATLLVLVVYWYWESCKNLPPGPWGLPVVGYLPFLSTVTPAEEQFHKLSQKYGKIMSFRLGSYLTVILDDFASIKEAYVKQADVFAGRPEGILFRVEKHDKGLMVTDGNDWKEHRRFAISTLRDYGMGKFTLEPIVMEEIHHLLFEISRQKERPFDLTEMLGVSAANVISTLQFGKRFDLANPKAAYLFHLVDDLVAEYDGVRIRTLFSWLHYIPFSYHITGHIRAVNYQKQLRICLKEIIEEHKKKYNENEMKDYIDAFLTKRNEIVKKIGNEGVFGSEDLEANLQNMHVAATETMVSTLRWALLLVMIYPDIQKRLHSELDQIIGMDRAPSMTDKPMMPYTDAFLCEVQRYGSVAPINLLHTNLDETTLYGYRIPKRTNIITNLWAINFDPKLWSSADKFIPERFINESGQVEKPDFFIPFGIGKRSCLGESLARMELFLYLTSVLQRFTILPPENQAPKLDIDSKIIRRPKPYKLRAIEREGYHVRY